MSALLQTRILTSTIQPQGRVANALGSCSLQCTDGAFSVPSGPVSSQPLKSFFPTVQAVLKKKKDKGLAPDFLEVSCSFLSFLTV